VIFKDDATDFRVICFMQNKSDLFEKFKTFEAAVRNRFGRPIREYFEQTEVGNMLTTK